MDDSSFWPREGCVRFLQKGAWRRKNGPVACAACRKRRVRCSGFETGAPCDSCQRRQIDCVVGEDTYPHDAEEQTQLFIPILPPPRPPYSSPSGDDAVAASPLDLTRLADALLTSGPRPAPLVWKSSPEELILPTVPPTRGRQKRSHPAPPTRSKQLVYAESSESGSDEELLLTASPVKRRKVDDEPLFHPQPQDSVVIEAAVALYSLKSHQLVSVGEWKASGREERGWAVKENDSLAHASFPMSTSRLDPTAGPSQSLSCLFPRLPLAAAPAQYGQILTLSVASTSGSSYHSRRASLISSTSAASATTDGSSTSFFGGDTTAAWQGSVTSVSDGEDGLEAKG
ncbi:hypothetical protein JCM10213_004773 [Rhodosporidiobolus nylandii]